MAEAGLVCKDIFPTFSAMTPARCAKRPVRMAEIARTPARCRQWCAYDAWVTERNHGEPGERAFETWQPQLIEPEGHALYNGNGDSPDTLEAMPGRVESIVSAAEHAALDLREEAEKRAGERIEEADRAAEIRVSAAEEEAEELLESARAQAETTRRQAESDAKRLRDETTRLN